MVKGRKRRISVTASTKLDEVDDSPRSPPSPAPIAFPFTLPISPTAFPPYSRSYATDSVNVESIFVPVTATRRYSEASSFPPVRGPDSERERRATISDSAPYTSTSAYELVTTPHSPFSSSSEADDSADGSYSTSTVEADFESQFASLPFTSFPPTGHDLELEAIFGSDSLYPNFGSHLDDGLDFDFEKFAAGVEGPLPASITAFDSYKSRAHPLLNQHLPFSILDFDFASDLPSSSTDPLGHLAPRISMSMPSMSMPLCTPHTLPPSVPLPLPKPSRDYTLPPPRSWTSSYPSPALSSAYAAASFPSLSSLPNGLGLHSSPEQQLYEAYLKRKAPATSATQHLPSKAFYMPAASPPLPEQPRSSVSVPSWSIGAGQGEVPEPGAFLPI